MPKRLLFTVSEETFRRFRHLAIDHGTSNAQLLAKLLDAHQQLLDFQTSRGVRCQERPGVVATETTDWS